MPRKQITYELNKGKAITLPNKDLSVSKALKAYRAGTFEEQIQTYYDSEMGQLPDFEDNNYPVDISKLSRIEQMELLNEVRADNAQYQKDLKEIENANNGQPEITIPDTGGDTSEPIKG